MKIITDANDTRRELLGTETYFDMVMSLGWDPEHVDVARIKIIRIPGKDQLREIHDYYMKAMGLDLGSKRATVYWEHMESMAQGNTHLLFCDGIPRSCIFLPLEREEPKGEPA